MNTYAYYQRISKLPFGNRIFSRLVTFIAPYFASIHPLIKDVRPGHCAILIKERRSIRNHIGTIHAIAMCNIAELAMGIVADVSIKPNLRWIPRSMKVEYLSKAKGTLTGICDIDPEIIVPGDVDVPVEVMNESGKIVFRAVITLYISEKPDHD